MWSVSPSVPSLVAAAGSRAGGNQGGRVKDWWAIVWDRKFILVIILFLTSRSVPRREGLATGGRSGARGEPMWVVGEHREDGVDP